MWACLVEPFLPGFRLQPLGTQCQSQVADLLVRAAGSEFTRSFPAHSHELSEPKSISI